MKVFAQLTKVDEEKRLVYGRAAEEMVDRSNEILDYAGSKPFFKAWSDEIAKDTNGASLGNVRAMHGKIAAGKLVDIEFMDEHKAIDVVAKVVDDNEWKKVLEGVYTGFSIGGSYGTRNVEKIDGKDITRYVAQPSEISLVDRPCIPSAKFFDVHKADGSLAKVEFKAPAAEDEKEYIVKGTAEELVALQKTMVKHDLSIGDVHARLIKEFGPDETDKDGKRVPPDGDKDEKVKPEGTKPPEGAKGTPKEEAKEGETPKKDEEVKEGEKVAPDGDLAKVDLEKMLGDRLEKAIAAAVAPLNEEIKKLKEQPAPSKIVLRALDKAADITGEKEPEAPPSGFVKDEKGEVRSAATMIKALHAQRHNGG